MSYEVCLTDAFKKAVRHLKKRYPSVTEDVKLAIENLSADPTIGVVIPGGRGARKARLRNSDLQKGKSGGYRLIYLVEDIPEPVIYFLLIYEKSTRKDIHAQEILTMMRELGL